jgi:hypothetical protein
MLGLAALIIGVLQLAIDIDLSFQLIM